MPSSHCSSFARLRIISPAVSKARVSHDALHGRALRLTDFASVFDVRPRQPDIDFPLHIGPFLCRPQTSHELLERISVSGCVFEPGEEVERLTAVAPVVQAAGNGG